MVIFYADDDEDDRYLFNEVIKRINPDIIIIEAEDGSDAVHILSQAQINLPDIIFLDINMPLLNGYETLLELRKNERLKNTKFVLYSTADKMSLPSARKNGLNVQYVRKSNTLKDSIETLRAVIYPA
ncbi:MAG: response regulator [Cyclobacteriaceae bacterium]